MAGRLLLRFVIVVIVLAGAVVAGINYFRPTAFVAPVERETAVDAAPGTVTVMAGRVAEVRSEISGRIATSNLKLGATVKAGDMLVQIDPTELKIQIERDESEVAAAGRRVEIGVTGNAELLNAKDALALNEELFKKGSIGELEVQRFRRAVAQREQLIELEKVNLQQSLDRLESELALNKHKLELMTLRSPIDGIVSGVFADAGDLINSGSPVARITSNSRIVEAKVSEENFAGVKVGQKATVRFTQYGGWLYDAKVEQILPEADPATQRYRVHMEVTIEPEKLVPGITGEASITLAESPNALVVPRTALVGDNVFVVVGGRVERRAVETGFLDISLVEIKKGLSEGELVIVQDLDRYRDGDRVRARPADEDAAGGA